MAVQDGGPIARPSGQVNPLRVAGPGGWARGGIALLVAALLLIVLRLPADPHVLRVSYGLGMAGGAVIAAIATLRIWLRRRDMHRAWILVGLGTTVALAAGAADAVAPIGQDRIGFIVAVAAGVPTVAVGLYRALGMQQASLDDVIDATVLTLSATFVMWEFRYQPAIDPTFDPKLSLVTLLFSFACILAASLAALSSRDGGFDPVRRLLPFAFVAHALGITLAPNALSGGLYADNALGSSLSLLGSLLLVGTLLSAFSVSPIGPSDRPRTVMWWAPMAASIAVYTVHSAFRGSLKDSQFDPLEVGIIGICGALLVWRIARTMTQRDHAHEVLAEDRRRLEVLLNDVQDSVVIFHTDGTVMADAGTSPTGLSAPADVTGQRVLDLIHPHDRSESVIAFQQACAHSGAAQRWEGRIRRPDGAWAWVECVIVDRRSEPAVGGVVATFRDVTARRLAELDLERLALFDQLTGLPSRESLIRQLSAELEAAAGEAHVSLLYCDLDRLKVVNDSLGHHVGDELIRSVAARWKALLPADGMLSRIGGDEFLVYLRHDDIDEAERLANGLLTALTEPVQAGPHRFTVSASIGVTTLTDRGQRPEAAIRDADAALYEAKARGRNQAVRFDSGMREAALERLALEQDLREALQRDEVEVHLQPIVQLRDGRPVSFEALVRWTHPTRGQVPPPRLIQVAEETGLIVPLGAHVLERACGAIRLLRDRTGLPLRATVNTSPSQLGHAEFLSTVQQVLDDHDLPPDALVLEITEGVILDAASSATLTLSALHEGGLGIAVDDFGTGYSSLSYLGTFPLDQLKLDRSLVSAAGSPTGEAVITGILHITSRLGVDVVAEGVETAEQAALLARLGVSHAQGWHYARAMPPEQASSWAQGVLSRSVGAGSAG